MKYKKILYPAVFLLLIALTIGTIVSQNESFSAEGFADFVSAANLKYMVGAALSMLCYIMMEGMALLVLCRALGYERRLHCGMMYSAADIYFSAITPSATGGQPASAILMMRDGIPGAVTTVALLMNLALYTLSILAMSLMGRHRPAGHFWQVRPGFPGADSGGVRHSGGAAGGISSADFPGKAHVAAGELLFEDTAQNAHL